MEKNKIHTASGKGTLALRLMFLLALIAVAQSSCMRPEKQPFQLSIADNCTQTLPNPEIRFDRQDAEGRVYIPVVNWSSYPDALFRRAPELPPCGLNTSSSRTWVEIYDADTNQRIFGHCSIYSSSGLKNIWFRSSTNSGRVYIIMNDRACGKTYKSSTILWP